MVPTHRRRAPRRGALVALFIVSVALHAAAAVFALALGGEYVRSGEGATSRAEEASLMHCEVEATLAAAARAGLCAMPFAERQPQCARGPIRALELDLIQCRGRAGPAPFLADSDMQVALVDPEVLAAIEPMPLDEEASEQPEQASPELSRDAQIVEITEPSESERPDNARFLSDYDSAVDRETVARGSTDEMVARPERREAERARAEAGERRAGDEGEGGDGREAGRELALRDPRERPGTAEGLDAPDGPGEMPARGEAPREREPSRGGSGAGGRPGSSGPDLRPSEELLARAMEGGGSVDYLEGVEEGEETALNSAQWKHASFFNRIKREVAQQWKPAQVYRSHDPDGSAYGFKDRVTVVRVWLKPDGSLVRVAVVRKSGLDFLDEEAVRAFRAAAPFPNPPSALVDARSQAIAFNFGFHFQLGQSGDRWRIFRSR